MCARAFGVFYASTCESVCVFLCVRNSLFALFLNEVLPCVRSRI